MTAKQPTLPPPGPKPEPPDAPPPPPRRRAWAAIDALATLTRHLGHDAVAATIDPHPTKPGHLQMIVDIGPPPAPDLET